MTRGKIAAATTVDATLTFLGAAGEVTGSSFLVETAGLRFLVAHGQMAERDREERMHSFLAGDDPHRYRRGRQVQNFDAWPDDDPDDDDGRDPGFYGR